MRALHGTERNLDIRLVVTEGTGETINKIEDGSTDLGLISGAIENSDTENVLEWTAICRRPTWSPSRLEAAFQFESGVVSAPT